MNRDIAPRLHSLLQAFKRFAGAPGGASLDRPRTTPSRAPGGAAGRSDPEPAHDGHDAVVTTPISVVVANCSRPESIARCLAAVLAQRFDPQSFEVIVVDDSGRDDVSEMVDALTPVCGRPVVRYLRVDAGGVSARNLGWRAAKGVLIAFTDEKSLPDPEWLASGERAMRGGHQALGGSLCVPASKQPTAAQLGELQSTSAFVRREMLEHVGGFDERCATV